MQLLRLLSEPGGCGLYARIYLLDAILCGEPNPPLWGVVQLHPQDAIALIVDDHLDWVKLEELLWAFTWIKRFEPTDVPSIAEYEQ